MKLQLTSTLRWVDANRELPKRDVPVLIVASVRGKLHTFVSEIKARGWAKIVAPATVLLWAYLPPPPEVMFVNGELVEL